MKQKSILCTHVGLQQFLVNNRETYSPVVNWISVRSLLCTASKHEFLIRSIDFVLDFPQSDPDMYVSIEFPLGT